jgi:hypothetical protein
MSGLRLSLWVANSRRKRVSPGRSLLGLRSGAREQVDAVVRAGRGGAVGSYGVQDADGVGLVGQASSAICDWSAQRKALTSLLAVRTPPVALQRKTRAMMPSVMFL